MCRPCIIPLAVSYNSGVFAFRLQEYENTSDASENVWLTVATYTQVPITQQFVYDAVRLDERFFYSYRVITNRTESDKLVLGGVSPASNPVQPVCPSEFVPCDVIVN